MTRIDTSFKLPCGAILKNRIAKAALTERLARHDHLPNELHSHLYNHWASHGAGLLISGNILIDQRYLESIGNVVIEGDTATAPFEQWTRSVSKYDCHFWAQLNHAGRQSSRFSTRHPVSASAVQLKKMGLFSQPRALTEIEIKEIISRFVSAAVFCKNVGFTGVQFHAAHGYLLSQFLSPNINLRQDHWGGNIANRARLLVTIVEQARESLGSDFCISVKLNSADFQRGGFSEDDAEYVILELEKRGVDLLEISGGTYEQSAMLGVGMKESTRTREAYFLDFAKKIRVKCKMPLMVTGGFRTLAVCEEALQDDDLDIVGFGRPFLVQEDFPNGFLNGTIDKVVDPTIKVLDKKNTDATEAGYYDILIERLARGQSISDPVGLLASNLRIPVGEGSKAFKKWSRSLFG